HYLITFLYKCYRTSNHCFRRDVSDHESSCSAGEPAVCDHCDPFSKTLTYKSSGYRQHLAHAGSTLWTFIPYDHDVTLHYLALGYCFKCLFFRVKHAGFAYKSLALDACQLHNCSVWCKSTLQYLACPFALDRVV